MVREKKSRKTLKKSQNKGFFITFEGIEGTGKTTHIIALSKFLKKKKLNVIITKEPGGTRIGKLIRKILLDPKNFLLNPLSELFLLLADRAQHVKETIIPYLNKKYIVISDRYADSSVAYQAAGRNISTVLIKKLNDLAIRNTKPGLTFLLEADLATSLKKVKKLSKEYKGGDRIEQESLKFHKKVKKEYLKLLKTNKNRMVRIPLQEKVADTQKLIRDVTVKKLKRVNIL
ncbi:MAG: dTMP kinase [Spirochaetes bacterium]|nr:dTMP kinase [Spirochaetota bacterium]